MKIQLNYGLNSKYGQKIFKGEIVYVYPDFDIGIIKVIGENDYVELGDSDNISLRDLVYTAVRNPKSPITMVLYRECETTIQTDTPVNPGNSGGHYLMKTIK